jgi:hypothetical protein
LDVQQRHCDGDWRGHLASRADASDIARRLGDYAAGYADRQAERARD